MSQTQVLARKWRPRNFSELTGQDHIVKAITHSLEQNRLHHAYLFTGTRGVGKTTIARILAKALNCEAGVTPMPCGACPACISIDKGNFIDLVELDAASNTQVDSMRELLESASYAPTAGRYKVYLIDEVHMLSRSAFNAMLKTLEEPPEHVKFILATTDPQKIPITVLSRCLQFNLKQIPSSLIAVHLGKILSQEQIAFDAASLQFLARAAQGSMRDALSLLDQAIAYGNGVVQEADVHAMLGVIDQEYLYDLLEALARKDGVKMLSIADEMEARSLAFDSALQGLAAILHRVALVQIAPQAIDETLPECERLFALAKYFTAEDVQLYYQIVLHGRNDLNLAPDEYAGFTMTLIRMLAFIPEQIFPGETSKNSGEDRDIRQEPIKVMHQATNNSQPAHNKEAEIASSSNEGWLSIVNQLGLNGMTKMLAQHCEAKLFTTDVIELCVPEMHKYLLEKAYQDKLKAALEHYFNKPVKVTFSIGTITGMTSLVMQEREKQARQSETIAAMEADPFVREIVKNFDAKLIISSIKPIE
ncbi:DNA polymerase III subunit gamma/tau [Nitrosomonas sp. Nm34]|uniref:DNA polymerase III subunit gamma/tau n=1 Tax=Nitrosomonas sp. Nm34 TaxID=1881055 RepID=UPI0008EFDF77|nr:DNA polymerase III subunit gamma/tau [Nitrosomonas sp. Nm34]SFI71566.1 DNA polymerase-3 subunit gamma/tau [Nitrosomonas sp. Nm34]